MANSAPVWEEDGADWPHREASRFVNAAGYRWHVQEFGATPVDTGDLPTVLLLHGTGAATHSWAGLAPLIADRARVIALDFPGHGFTRSDGRAPQVTIRHFAETTAALMTELRVRPSICIGHSAGAAVGLYMALFNLAPFAHFVSLNGALKPFPGAASVMFPAFAKLLFYNPFSASMLASGGRDPSRVRRLLEQTGSKVDERTVALYGRLLSRSDHVSGALAMMANWDLPGLWRAMPGLKVDALFIASERDSAVPPAGAEEAARRVKRGEAIMLPGLGHLAHEEDPSAVLAAVDHIFGAPDR